MKSLTASVATAFLTLPGLFAQGPLDPIEPRMPIGSLPFIIARSGSVTSSTARTYTSTDLVRLHRRGGLLQDRNHVHHR
jgi:hypothetical protein